MDLLFLAAPTVAFISYSRVFSTKSKARSEGSREPGERIKRSTTKKKKKQSWWCEYRRRDVMVAVVAVAVAMVSVRQ